jgi:hypothetical protein
MCLGYILVNFIGNYLRIVLRSLVRGDERTQRKPERTLRRAKK